MVFLEPPAKLHTLLKEALPGSLSTPDDPDEILAYIASKCLRLCVSLAHCSNSSSALTRIMHNRNYSALAQALADTQNFASNEWVDALSPYLSNLIDDQSDVEEIIAKYCGAAETALQQEDDSSDEEYEYGGEEITDIRFSLAYGGKILLHQTKLRLRRGHRYALVGQNGVGKTTLMNAINNGKLEGWPAELRTEYVDSGSNVNPVYEAKIVFDELVSSTQKSEDDCKALLQQLKFTDQMMSGSIGELSGGWQMKLRLAKAVLIDADILLMDEPTNHLDTGTVKWLEDYLLGLTSTTVLIVSHDTQFLENVVSDGESIETCFVRLSRGLTPVNLLYQSYIMKTDLSGDRTGSWCIMRGRCLYSLRSSPRRSIVSEGALV